ncbi:MAG: hypothetical protein AB7F35_27625 [Acetobacteraceae bacterium]
MFNTDQRPLIGGEQDRSGPVSASDVPGNGGGEVRMGMAVPESDPDRACFLPALLAALERLMAATAASEPDRDPDEEEAAWNAARDVVDRVRSARELPVWPPSPSPRRPHRSDRARTATRSSLGNPTGEVFSDSGPETVDQSAVMQVVCRWGEQHLPEM